MFDPNKHLIEIKTNQGNKPYLPVVHRVAWFRDVCSEGSIETEMLHLDLVFLGVSDGTTHPETATEKTGPLGDKWVHL